MKNLIHIIVSACLASGCIPPSSSDDSNVNDPKLKKGDLAPSWELQYASGETEHLANWTTERDKELRNVFQQPDRHVVVLIFYGSWCPPCVWQLTPLEEIHQKYKNERAKFFIVDDTEYYRKSKERALFTDAPLTPDLFHEKGISIPFLLDNERTAGTACGIQATPTILVIDRFQTVQEVVVGFDREESDEFKSSLSQTIDRLLTEEAEN